MIKNEWYGICPGKCLTEKRGLQVTLHEQNIIIFQTKDGLKAFKDQCTHRGSSFKLGEIKNDHLICPYHHFKFDSDGQIVEKPAEGVPCKCNRTYQLTEYHVALQDDIVWLYYGETPETPPPLIEGLPKDYTLTYFQESWPVHYTRAAEAQLDVFHLPFVHPKTIGRGNRTLAHGPKVEWLNSHWMKIWVHNTKQGEIRLTGDEFTQNEMKFSLDFYMPNVWRNNISKNMQIVALFVPTKEDETITYLITYQNLVKFPVLKQLFHFMTNHFNKKILHEDKDMVLGQPTGNTTSIRNERLIAADLPIVAFRKWNKEKE